MFMGAYWSERKESREQAAERLARFLEAVSREDPAMTTWYKKARSKAAANTPVGTDPASIASNFRVNRRDVDNEVIPDLGFSFSAWNGESIGLSAAIGAFSPYVLNSVVLSCAPGSATKSPSQWRRILEAAVAAFQPEHAVVTSHELLTRVGADHPWEAGWLTYQPNRGVQEHDVT